MPFLRKEMSTHNSNTRKPVEVGKYLREIEIGKWDCHYSEWAPLTFHSNEGIMCVLFNWKVHILELNWENWFDGLEMFD